MFEVGVQGKGSDPLDASCSAVPGQSQSVAPSQSCPPTDPQPGAEVRSQGGFRGASPLVLPDVVEPSAYLANAASCRKSNPSKELQHCPECGSSGPFDKDGIRYTAQGPIQRFLCRNCSYRFSETSINRDLNPGPMEKPLQETSKHSLNNGSALLSNRQVCVALTRGAKNLIATEIKTVAGDTTPTGNNGLILEFAWHMKKKGLADTTIKNRSKLLNLLAQKGADFMDTNSVETVLATETWKIPLKHELVAAYYAFCKYRKVAWEKVKVNYEPKQVYTPTEEEINFLIGRCGKRLATFLMILRETGARKGEALKIRYADVNSNTNEISINYPEKNGKSRKVKVTERTIAMINALPKKHGDNLFSTNPHAFDSTFNYTRKASADKLQNPNIRLIHFHTFRYLRGRKEYRKHKDVYEAKYLLGHKSILSTQRYTEGEEFQGDEYYSAEAKTKEEAKQLIEAGYSYVTDVDGFKLFSKPK